MLWKSLWVNQIGESLEARSRVCEGLFNTHSPFGGGLQRGGRQCADVNYRATLRLLSTTVPGAWFSSLVSAGLEALHYNGHC
jgi:hypothetical protein